jgi:hypothetical protein
MIEDDFYATIKLKNGEEIFAKVSASEEEDDILLLVANPIVISEVKLRDGSKTGYKVEPWLKTTKEDLFVINLNDVLTMSETKDLEIIMMHQSFIRKQNTGSTYYNDKLNMTRRMGYISTVNEAKNILEIYKTMLKVFIYFF